MNSNSNVPVINNNLNSLKDIPKCQIKFEEPLIPNRIIRRTRTESYPNPPL